MISRTALWCWITLVSFSIPDGASVAIVGKSGSGKSSLVHSMSGLSRPELGQVLIDGQDILRLPQKQVDQFRLQDDGVYLSVVFCPNESGRVLIMLACLWRS